MQRLTHNQLQFTTAAILTVTSVVLTGCSSSDSTSSTNSKASAPAEPAASTASPTRKAGNLGTRVCINNTTGRSIVIDVTSADTGTGERTLENGRQTCAEGTKTFSKLDVEGVINKGGDDFFTFGASNPWVGTPRFMRIDTCVPENADYTYAVGQTRTFTDLTLVTSITRTKDGQWKNFDVYLTNGDGVTKDDVKCKPVVPRF